MMFCNAGPIASSWYFFIFIEKNSNYFQKNDFFINFFLNNYSYLGKDVVQSAHSAFI